MFKNCALPFLPIATSLLLFEIVQALIGKKTYLLILASVPHALFLFFKFGGVECGAGYQHRMSYNSD